jgi:uncharacterized iron-regulated membrane protein
MWHRAFGLGAALWIVLLALTGSAIAFYDDLDRWLNPDWRSIPTAAPQVPDIDLALRNARATLPDFAPRFVDLPNAPDATLALLGSATLAGVEKSVQIFIDPRDSSVLGWRDSERISLHRRQLMDTLYALHTELLLHETGVWLIGLVALLWLIDHFAGVLLAIPRLGAALSAWRIAGRGLNLRRLYDLHRAPSMWLLPLTFTLALTGWCLSWYAETRALVGLVSPVSERLHESFPDIAAPAHSSVGINAAIRSVRAGVTGEIDSVMVLPRQAAWGVRSFDARDIDDLGRLWTYVSMVDGRVLGQRHDNGSSAGDTFFAWQYPLHSGRAFGLPGQALVSAAGIGTTLLCVTGVWLWWRRRG